MRTSYIHACTPAVALVAMALLPASTRAEEAHRELGPHVHGHGTLNIAVEDKRLSLELEVPGMDIVGFEHAPSTDEQKAVVEKAKAELAKPLSVFGLPAAAGCSVASANVAIEAEHHHDGDDDHDHDHAAADADHKDGAADHDHDEHEGHEGHNEFHVTYALDCSQPSELSSIEFPYFKLFGGAHDLTVNVVTAKAQTKYEVSRDKPSLDLGGIM
jgi:hypothetical protein